MPIIGSRGAASIRGFGAFGGADLISASGGSTEDIGEYRVHTFTSSGTFTIDKISGAVPGPAQVVDYVVVGGGAAGGYAFAGGGGAGGFRESHVDATSGPYTASPLASSTSIPISASPGSYPITVGAGGGYTGPASGGSGQAGGTSTFSTINASGGGGGGGTTSGNPGGSGGGGGANGGSPGGSGNSGGYSPPEGNNGATGSPQTGGGGGAGAAGNSGGSTGSGGSGVGTEISATAGIQGPSAPLRYFAGGGSPSQRSSGGGGVGGGGGSPYNFTTPDYPGPTNKGQPGTGGGAKGDFYANPQTGGSGAVVIRYKYK
tara:strand:+ start:69 stop:1019 length:951 start_codon:yes stop_codon:yes gene_type:complete